MARRRIMAGYSQNSFFKALVGAKNGLVCDLYAILRGVTAHRHNNRKTTINITLKIVLKRNILLTYILFYLPGNVSVGNLNKFLPFVLREIESQPRRQYLLLHSLKEVKIDLTNMAKLI